ncbi:MAG: N-acetylmuramoyl-L-alanine amidase [Candidatus Omnitrophota bacterium]
MKYRLGIYCLLLLLLTSCTTARVSGPSVTTVHEPTGPAGFTAGRAYHTVAPGETLWRISKMYDADVETIKEANRIRNVKKVEIGQRLYIPGASPRKNVITMYPNRRWKYIIVHHSATNKGNSMQFNRSHLRRGWEGVGYHFIIDNGTYGKDDGQIETGPRWTKQRRGAHCKARKMNKKAIGICLVGNFSRSKPTKKQMESLTYLVNKLRKYYRIPKKRVLGHGQVRGAKTECPGKRFPWRSFKSSL